MAVHRPSRPGENLPNFVRTLGPGTSDRLPHPIPLPLQRALGERVSLSLRGEQSTALGLPLRNARCSLSLSSLRERVRGNGAAYHPAYRTVPGNVELGESSGRAGGFSRYYEVEISQAPMPSVNASRMTWSSGSRPPLHSATISWARTSDIKPWSYSRVSSHSSFLRRRNVRGRFSFSLPWPPVWKRSQWLDRLRQ